MPHRGYAIDSYPSPSLLTVEYCFYRLPQVLQQKIAVTCDDDDDNNQPWTGRRRYPATGTALPPALFFADRVGLVFFSSSSGHGTTGMAGAKTLLQHAECAGGRRAKGVKLWTSCWMLQSSDLPFCSSPLSRVPFLFLLQYLP